MAYLHEHRDLLQDHLGSVTSKIQESEEFINILKESNIVDLLFHMVDDDEDDTGTTSVGTLY